jgi:hypothetical protein
MARGERKLKAIALRSLPAGMHGDGGGLWLQVTPSGARSWIFRFTLGGTLGRWAWGLCTLSPSPRRGTAR